MPTDTIIVLDYGSQTAQLIARRVRETGVYCELFAWDAPEATVMDCQPKGFILSGGPASVYEPDAPTLPPYVLQSGLPTLGICYGMQLLAHTLGGRVAASTSREYGPALLRTDQAAALWTGLPETLDVWMSHGDRIEQAPPGFVALAHTENAPIAAMGDPARRLYGIQFHPEVTHTPRGTALLKNFAASVCGCAATWQPSAMLDDIITRAREQVGKERVLLGLSGGVDSAVAAAVLQRAIGDQLTCVFVDHGLLRQGEAAQVINAFQPSMGKNLMAVNAVEEFLSALEGVTDPEEKRRRIGETFIRVFEREARKLGDIPFLAQGTIYPDVIESAAPDRPNARRIKSHHNVGGLPAEMNFQLIEPLRYLFKDEVRKLGEALGLPDELIWRQPFPGPGLAVRCVGEVTWDRLERLRAADAIFIEELNAAGLTRGETAQAFAALLPVRSVGVMGDHRTHGETIALRAVTTDDFMTADWARLPYDVLARASSRIVNEVGGVSRVVYDVSSKPPATIEWE